MFCIFYFRLVFALPLTRTRFSDDFNQFDVCIAHGDIDMHAFTMNSLFHFSFIQSATILFMNNSKLKTTFHSQSNCTFVSLFAIGYDFNILDEEWKNQEKIRRIILSTLYKMK